MSMFERVDINQILSEQNKIVDAMVKFTRVQAMGPKVYEEPPSLVFGVLLEDTNDIPNKRGLDNTVILLISLCSFGVSPSTRCKNKIK